MAEARTYQQYVMMKWLILISLVIFLLASCLVSLMAGSADISPIDVLKTVSGHGSRQMNSILWNVRLPRMAAAIADAPAELEDACTKYCLHLGNAFQIADDILDYAGEAETIGKNLGADLREGKVTLPLLYAMELAAQDDRELIREAVRKGEGDFERISRIVIESGALEKCRQKAFEEAASGEKAIAALGSGQFTKSLVQFLALSVRRDH